LFTGLLIAAESLNCGSRVVGSHLGLLNQPIIVRMIDGVWGTGSTVRKGSVPLCPLRTDMDRLGIESEPLWSEAGMWYGLRFPLCRTVCFLSKELHLD
jgi:hypothetical protein